MNTYTAVILAGGKSSRMGKDKLRLPVDGEGMLAAIAARFTARFGRVLLSVAREGDYPEIALAHIADRQTGAGPLAGLAAALAFVSDGGASGVFLCAGDMPFATAEAAERVCDLATGADVGCRVRGVESGALTTGFDICALTDAEGRPEPLFAWYGTQVLAEVEACLAQGRRAMVNLFQNCHTRLLTPRDLGDLWNARLLSNINDPAAYAALEKLA